MKIAVIGSRKFTDYAKFCFEMGELAQESEGHDSTVILSGGAKGVDTMAQKYAQECGLDFILFKPYHLIDNQMEYNPRFFFTRNKQIADNADWVIAFWNGTSSGTRHMIEYCQRHHKKVTVIEVKDD